MEFTAFLTGVVVAWVLLKSYWPTIYITLSHLIAVGKRDYQQIFENISDISYDLANNYNGELTDYTFLRLKQKIAPTIEKVYREWIDNSVSTLIFIFLYISAVPLTIAQLLGVAHWTALGIVTSLILYWMYRSRRYTDSLRIALCLLHNTLIIDEFMRERPDIKE